MKQLLFKALKSIASLLPKVGINRETLGAARVYDFFYKIFWPYGKVIEIQGSKMFINIKDESHALRETFEGYVNNLIHEKATTDLFKRIVKKGDVVVDLGANIGYFTLLAAKIVGNEGKVFAFEPEPNNFKYLRKNIEINNYTNVVALQKAVSEKNERIKLFICPYESGHHTIKQQDGIKAYRPEVFYKEKSIDIEAVSLDGFFEGKRKIDVVKMDVEGAEALALRGMDEILRANRNIKIFVEFFPLLIEKMGDYPKEFIRELLEDYKFSIFVIPDDYNAAGKELKKINSAEELMAFRKGEADHINLFIKK